MEENKVTFGIAILYIERTDLFLILPEELLMDMLLEYGKSLETSCHLTSASLTLRDLILYASKHEILLFHQLGIVFLGIEHTKIECE